MMKYQSFSLLKLSIIFILVCNYQTFSIAKITNAGIYTQNYQTQSILLAKKDDTILYKKDIIISSEELENTEEVAKPVEKYLPESKNPVLINAKNLLKKGKKYEARNLLSDHFLKNKIPKKQAEIKRLLDTINEELVFSSLPSKDASMYTVQSGDTLSRIAGKFNTNYELIMRINGKSNTNLKVGEKLKVISGKTKILIDKSDFTLTLLLNDHYVKQYSISTGRNNKTPSGIFEVKNKLKNPTWYAPNGGVFQYGDEKNILGTRWIGFKEKPGISGYGIHGTTQPETIGTAASDGCIRMYNRDVEELYNFVTSDTIISINE